MQRIVAAREGIGQAQMRHVPGQIVALGVLTDQFLQGAELGWDLGHVGISKARDGHLSRLAVPHRLGLLGPHGAGETMTCAWARLLVRWFKLPVRMNTAQENTSRLRDVRQ